MPRLSETQRDERRQGLGASDVAVLAGVNPWKTSFELYLEKIGELDPEARESQASLDRQERGHRLEDVALAWDAEIRGDRFERVHRTIWHPRLPFLFAHPDARRVPWSKTRRLVEAKTSARRVEEPRQHWRIQAQAQMAVTGAEAVDIVVLGFDGPPARFTENRNPALIEALEGLSGDFWDLVTRREPPPIDGSRAASRWLDRMTAEGVEQEIRADGDQSRMLARLLELRGQVKALELEDDEIVNLLKFSMAGSSRLFAPAVGSVLWTAPSERRTVAWKEVAAALRRLISESADARLLSPSVMETVEAIECTYTRTDEGIRQFRVTPAKDRQEAA